MAKVTKPKATVTAPIAPVTAPAVTEKKIIRVADLAEKYGLEARQLRAFIRSLGFKAPATGIEGFGPKSKYEWTEDSKELADIEAAVVKSMQEDPAPAPTDPAAPAAQ